MDQINVVVEEDILRIAEKIDSILSRVQERFGCSWDQVGGDSQVRSCVDFVNGLCEESLPKNVNVSGSAANLIISGMNPSDVWDGTLSGALKPAMGPFKALFHGATGNILGVLAGLLEAGGVVLSAQDNENTILKTASQEVLRARCINLFYRIEFADRTSLRLTYSPATFFCTSMTPSRVHLGGTITRGRHLA